jgi:hypothetical protein
MEDVEGDERMDDVDMAPPTNGLDTNSNFHDYSNNSSNVPVEDLTGQIQQEKVARRFLVWIILMITNIICIIAICLGRRHDSAEEKWAISIVTLSFVVSFASVLCYLFARAVFASGPLELGMVRKMHVFAASPDDSTDFAHPPSSCNSLFASTTGHFHFHSLVRRSRHYHEPFQQYCRGIHADCQWEPLSEFLGRFR